MGDDFATNTELAENHFLTPFPDNLAKEPGGLSKKSSGEQQRRSSYATPHYVRERIRLHTLGSVASYLENRAFILINDRHCRVHRIDVWPVKYPKS
jgi:hypothetical protein